MGCLSKPVHFSPPRKILINHHVNSTQMEDKECHWLNECDLWVRVLQTDMWNKHLFKLSAPNSPTGTYLIGVCVGVCVRSEVPAVILPAACHSASWGTSSGDSFCSLSLLHFLVDLVLSGTPKQRGRTTPPLSPTRNDSQSLQTRHSRTSSFQAVARGAIPGAPVLLCQIPSPHPECRLGTLGFSDNLETFVQRHRLLLS